MHLRQASNVHCRLIGWEKYGERTRFLLRKTCRNLAFGAKCSSRVGSPLSATAHTWFTLRHGKDRWLPMTLWIVRGADGTLFSPAVACNGGPRYPVLRPPLFLVHLDSLAAEIELPCYLLADNAENMGTSRITQYERRCKSHGPGHLMGTSLDIRNHPATKGETIMRQRDTVDPQQAHGLLEMKGWGRLSIGPSYRQPTAQQRPARPAECCTNSDKRYL